jgi:hypothetical protein
MKPPRGAKLQHFEVLFSPLLMYDHPARSDTASWPGRCLAQIRGPDIVDMSCT